MAITYPFPPQPASKKAFCIAGIITTVYGLEELNADVQDVACLWLLHPRLQTQKCMEPIAYSNIENWRVRNEKVKKGIAIGLICVSFDQRNHGSREVDRLSNEAWRNGNPKHAQDMFASYRRVYRLYHTLKITKNCRRDCHGHLPPLKLHHFLYIPKVRTQYYQ